MLQPAVDVKRAGVGVLAVDHWAGPLEETDDGPDGIILGAVDQSDSPAAAASGVDNAEFRQPRYDLRNMGSRSVNRFGYLAGCCPRIP